MQNVFEEIINEAIEKAEAIKCPLPEFYKGLEEMQEILEQRISIKHEEL